MIRICLKSVFCLIIFSFFIGAGFAAQEDLQLPAGTLNGKQIKSLFAGKTVAANSADGKEQELVIYFGPDGQVRQAKKGWLQKGKWKIREDDRLCVNLKGARRDCRILVKNGNEYRQYAVKLNGKHTHELTYVDFKQGNHLAQMSKMPILPLGTLNKKQLVKLFTGKTVESITAKKGRISQTYYAPDGTVEQVQKGNKRFGKWRVTRNGRMCLKMEDLEEKCRIIVDEDGEFKKYIVRKSGRHQHSVSYRKFTAGKRL